MVCGMLADYLTMSRTTGEVELKSVNHGVHVNSLSNSTQARVVMKKDSLALTLYIGGGREEGVFTNCGTCGV